MSPGFATVILFGSLLVTFALGIPVAFALGGTAILLGLLLLGPSVFLFITPAIESSLTNFLLLSMPLVPVYGTGDPVFRARGALVPRAPYSRWSRPRRASDWRYPRMQYLGCDGRHHRCRDHDSRKRCPEADASKRIRSLSCARVDNGRGRNGDFESPQVFR